MGIYISYRERAKTISAVFVAALVLIWPAIYNGYPLLYPDSMSYLQDGRRVANSFSLHNFPTTYGGRSFIYCLGILPFHQNVTPLPILGLNAIITAYVLWLVVRSIRQPTVTAYLLLIIPLSFVTGLSWFVSYIMPDILGPLLYLCLYLIAFTRRDLSRTEIFIVAGFAWWAIASHPTHLILAGLLCFLVPLVLIAQRQPRRQWLGAFRFTAAILCLAGLSQVTLHTYLYGSPSLNGKRIPFLMARTIADGPGRWYLQQHCVDLNLSICDQVNNLPNNVAEFLWSPTGIWRTRSAAQQDQLRQEEMTVVLGAIRNYPWTMLRTSANHFWRQLEAFGLNNYYPDPWIMEQFDETLPGSKAIYLGSRQASQTLHEQFFTRIQEWTVIAALIAMLTWGILLRPSPTHRIYGLLAVVMFVMIANAAVSGILSNVEDRYQSRVIWLVPLIAGLGAIEWLNNRQTFSKPSNAALSSVSKCGANL
jgi:hypothetical protein